MLCKDVLTLAALGYALHFVTVFVVVVVVHVVRTIAFVDRNNIV